MFGKIPASSPNASASHKPSGFELMVRSLMPPGLMDEVKKLVESGAIGEIALFAQEVKKIRETNELILRELEALRKALPDGDGSDTKPGSGFDDGFRERQLAGPNLRTVGTD
jgi:hypothetical protein